MPLPSGREEEMKMKQSRALRSRSFPRPGEVSGNAEASLGPAACGSPERRRDLKEQLTFFDVALETCTFLTPWRPTSDFFFKKYPWIFDSEPKSGAVAGSSPNDRETCR
jgi:hypothetical protein